MSSLYLAIDHMSLGTPFVARGAKNIIKVSGVCTFSGGMTFANFMNPSPIAIMIKT